ncbi:MAG: hypothetical protein C4523_00780 [Myxococcales bacterium]|nr:MAG: hypothetical protein C4523_00780 [Myxococcales bacterium]
MEIVDLEIGYDNTLFILALTDKVGEYLYSLRFNDIIESKKDCVMTDSPHALAIKGPSRILHIGTSGGIYEYNNTDCVKKTALSGWPTGWVIDMDGTETDRFAVVKQTPEGTFELHIRDGQWTVYTPAEGLIEGALRSVRFFEDESADRKDVIVASDQGVQILDKRRTFRSLLPVPCAADDAYAKDCSLPDADVRQLAVAPDFTFWAAGAKGAFTINPDSNALHWRVFQSRRWLLDDPSVAVGFDAEGGVWIGHADGATRLWLEDWTLKRKADLHLDALRRRHLRMGGFVAPAALPGPGDIDACGVSPDACPVAPNDDEALWTGLYALTETFRALAADDPTEREDARANASASIQMLIELLRATPRPGLPARTILPRGAGPLDDPSQGEWSRSDYYDWKGDPGPTALVGHLVAYPFFYDLLAGAEEKRAIEDTLNSIAVHLRDHDWRLIDTDGLPTTDGNWGEAAVTGAAGQAGLGGVRALELLALLRAAYHLTGDETFWTAYIERAHEAHYAEATRHQKTLSDSRRGDYAADLLALAASLILLRYDDVVDFREIYMASLKEMWEAKRAEASPLTNLVYGVYAHSEFDLNPAVSALRETPVDLVDWRLDTCWRKDAALSGEAGAQRLDAVLPAGERKLLRLDGDPYACEWGEAETSTPLGGLAEDDGLAFLLPYWMARYFEMLGPPTE